VATRARIIILVNLVRIAFFFDFLIFFVIFAL
jgi:hypothetical protein